MQVLLGNVSAGKGINKKGKGEIRASDWVTKSTKKGQAIVRADYRNKIDF